jgi:hypothetical protein
MGAGDPSDSEENSSSEYSESPKSSDGGVGSRLRLLFLPMVEAREGEESKQWRTARDIEEERQPLTSNHGHRTVAKHSISTSTRLKTRQAADAVSRNTTPIGTPVSDADDMITPTVTSHYYSEAAG